MSGAPASPNRMVYADKLYVTHTTGVVRYGNGTWTDKTPSSGTGQNYCGIAVDPSNTQKIVVSQRYSTFNNAMFRTTNQGSSWTQINTSSLPVNKHVEPAWWPSSWFSSATSCMAFDPLNSGNLYYTDWFGIWHSPNAWNSTMDFYTLEKGHEETVVLTLTAPPSGAYVYSGVADVFGFRHDALSSFPSKKLYDINEGFSIAVCEASPGNIAILGASGNNGSGTVLRTSSDFGETWTSRSLPSGAQLGRIVISSNDPNNMVYVDGGSGGKVYYTTNKGSSWTQAIGAPTGACGHGTSDVWNKDFSISPDYVDGTRFFIFDLGYLYASFNGGANWYQRNTTAIPTQTNFLNVVAAPGIMNEVWVSLHGNGLYKSSDGGKNFTKISAFSSATNISWGKSAPGTSTPTVFCYGKLSGVTGLYRSTDLGITWDQVDNGQKFPSGVKALAGDRQTFGRVYVGTGGRGVLYGQP